ncbi:hypothetical protein RFI_02201 [Reticulomyxa filosa]|uniref:Caspase family p20 domain-containing protein n=1 Tax=Reticulomyxa filosa TaxID=46433 RepID=X6P9Q6_RETFI|nr:hypothetical protein RFI_02201 [Reticulomyxa filosa]|eukprot:ETO34886.1 hypothetical protein RFI_02201 [Reticulomyxa filosa]
MRFYCITISKCDILILLKVILFCKPFFVLKKDSGRFPHVLLSMYSLIAIIITSAFFTVFVFPIIIRTKVILKRFEFKKNQPSFKIIWTPFQPIIGGKTKAIKNALVMMIAINVKNFKQLFKKELNYDECNKSPQMTKTDVQSFLVELVATHRLHKNTNKYDVLIIIICGHGKKGNML